MLRAARGGLTACGQRVTVGTVHCRPPSPISRMQLPPGADFRIGHHRLASPRRQRRLRCQQSMQLRRKGQPQQHPLRRQDSTAGQRGWTESGRQHHGKQGRTRLLARAQRGLRVEDTHLHARCALDDQRRSQRVQIEHQHTQPLRCENCRCAHHQDDNRCRRRPPAGMALGHGAGVGRRVKLSARTPSTAARLNASGKYSPFDHASIRFL